MGWDYICAFLAGISSLIGTFGVLFVIYRLGIFLVDTEVTNNIYRIEDTFRYLWSDILSFSIAITISMISLMRDIMKDNRIQYIFIINGLWILYMAQEYSVFGRAFKEYSMRNPKGRTWTLGTILPRKLHCFARYPAIWIAVLVCISICNILCKYLLIFTVCCPC